MGLNLEESNLLGLGKMVYGEVLWQSDLEVAGEALYYFTGTPDIDLDVKHNSLALGARIVE